MTTRKKASATAAPAAAMELAPAAKTTAVRLLVGQLFESPLNPRKHEKVDKDLEDLAKSIAQDDVIESLVVRPAPGDLTVVLDGGDEKVAKAYEIVAGSRRWKAAKLAGRADVPCVIRDVTDETLLRLALVENNQRRPMHALDEARAFVKLAEMDPIYRDDRVLASKIGRSETFVRDRRKLLKCDDQVIAALDADAITAKHAERIARLPKAQHGDALRACFRTVWTTAEKVNRQMKAGEWEQLRGALVTLDAYDAWAEQNAIVDVTDADVQQELPELRQVAEQAQGLANGDADGAAAIVASAFVQLSRRTYDVPKGVVPFGKWVEAKKHCSFDEKGIVVHGGRTQILMACRKDGCPVHFPKPKHTPKPKKAASSSAAKPSAAQQKAAEKQKQAQEAQRRREQVFQELLPELKAAFVKHVAKLKVTLALLKLAVGAFYYGWADGVKREWGVTATDANLGQVIALACVRTGKGETDELQFADDTKPFKFDAKKTIAALIAARTKQALAVHKLHPKKPKKGGGK